MRFDRHSMLCVCVEVIESTTRNSSINHSLNFPVTRSLDIYHYYYKNWPDMANIKNVGIGKLLPSFSTSSTAAGDLLKDLQYFGRKKQNFVSLKALIETGKGERLEHFENLFGAGSKAESQADLATRINIQMACFLHRELPIRLAHRALELEDSPLLKKSASIQNVCRWYKTSFAQLVECPVPLDKEKESKFASVLEEIYERHSSTLILMAKGAHELRTLLQKDIDSFADDGEIQKRLNDFYMSRIGVRMVVSGAVSSDENPVSGQVDDWLSLKSMQSCGYGGAGGGAVASDAAYMCSRVHGDAPEVEVYGRTDLSFPYVPSHLSYMLLELLKNSMRATVEKHGVDKMPPIRVVIADGEDNEDVVIKVSDEGGGIRRSNMNRIWSYLFTTADPAILENMLADTGVIRDFDTASPLAGLGYGLPISRNYARYFGGDLTIMSMEGYGTDGFIYLPRLSDSTPLVV